MFNPRCACFLQLPCCMCWHLGHILELCTEAIELNGFCQLDILPLTDSDINQPFKG